MISATLSSRFRNADGSVNTDLVRYADEVKNIYAVPIDKDTNDAMEVHAGVERVRFETGADEFGINYREEWGLRSNLSATPKIVTSQTVTGQPTYSWSYSGDGERIPAHFLDYGSAVVEGGADETSNQAALGAKFGDAPSVTTPGSDQSGWPKKGSVKVTMTPPPSLGLQPGENSYYINFHLPTENWEEVEKRPVLTEPDSRDVVPSEVIEFTKGTAAEGMSVRESFTAAGPSGKDESIKVWVNADTIKFWVGLSEADRNNINFLVNILGAYVGGDRGGRAIAGVLKPDAITKLDEAAGTLGKDVAKSAFSEGAVRQGWSFFEEAPEDTQIIENDWDSFERALTHNRFENLPAGAQDHISKLKAILSKIVASGFDSLSIEEKTLWTTEELFDNSTVWRFCRLAPVVQLIWEEAEYEGDLYKRDG